MEAILNKIKASVYLHNIARRKLAIYVTAISSVLIGFSLSPWGDSVESYLARAFEFSIRKSLGAYPKLDPKIKIFIFDDPMAAYLKGTDFSLEEWAMLLEGVAKQNPSAIVIDKIFGFPLEGDQEDFVKRVRATQVPVIVGAFVTPVFVQGRPFLEDIPHDQYKIDYFKYLPAGDDRIQPSYENNKNNLYGADANLRLAFSKFGHIVYDGNGYVKPYLRFAPDKVIPHLSFLLAKDYQFAKEPAVVANGVEVPVDRKGRMPINLAPASYYRSKTYGMKALFTHAKKNKPIPVISPGDIVILLPLMFTGNTDFVPTPAAVIEGGYILTSLINSVITGKFIAKIELYGIHILLASLLGAWFAAYLIPSWFWTALILSNLALILSGLLSFAYLSTMLPWLYPLFAITSTSMLIFAERHRNEKFEQVRVEKDLETARLVQDSFFPKESISTPRLNVIGYRESASECSGDWWYHLQSPDGKEFLFMADAMGHGTPAALLTAMCYASTLSLINRDSNAQGTQANPAQILTELNKIIYDALKGKVTMSVFAALVDASTQSLIYANAGHPFPILMTGNDAMPTSIRGSADPLGASPETSYQNTTLKIAKGHKILAFTDGLIEAQDAKKQKWGRKKLFEVLKNCQDANITDVSKNVIEAARAFHGPTFEEDDVTFFIAELAA